MRTLTGWTGALPSDHGPRRDRRNAIALDLTQWTEIAMAVGFVGRRLASAIGATELDNDTPATASLAETASLPAPARRNSPRGAKA